VTAATPTVRTPAGVATPTAQAERLRYFWPTVLPMGLVVQPEGSRADETGFVLELAQPGGGQFRATIVGGGESRVNIATPQPAARAITVRGQPGITLNTGAGATVYWREDGQPFGIISGLSLQDVQAIADGLQPLDLTTWQQRLQSAGKP
jgi:hypothetical protein